MVHFRSIFYLIGWLLLILAAAMIPSGILDYVRHCPDYKAYFLSSSITVFLGSLLVFSNRRNSEIEFGKKDSFLLTTLSWICGILFSSLPFLLCSLNLTLTDAIFETVSALTTTGATILKNIDVMPWGILLWRSILQWLGGIGIIVMALTLLTDMKIGGMELFQSEFSDRTEKFLPRVAQIAKVICITYTLLTLICAVCLWACGMSPFDAVCHSFTTLSTGGFSTHDQSIHYFDKFSIEIVIALFMFLGGTTQLLFIHFISHSWKSFFKDEQVQLYGKILAASVLMIIIWRLVHSQEDPLTIIGKSIFNVTSVLTTTGFESAPYRSWGGFSWIILFFLPFIGGCTGSTSGGIKVLRFQVLFEVTFNQLKKLWRPHGIFLPKFNHKKLSESIFESVAAFFVLFIFSFVLLTIALSLCGLDSLQSFTAAASTLTNLGNINLGEGSDSFSYATLSFSVKWILMFGMLLGRLELLTLYVLFIPSFWKS